MEIVKGQIVVSRAGRDVTRAYVVLEVQGERALLTDGRKRTLGSPKAKNLRHLAPTKTYLQPDQTNTDQNVRAALAAFEAVAGTRIQGGEQLV